MKPYSLRLRILLGVLATVGVAWTAIALLAYREARHEADELLDAHLAQSATLLGAFLGGESGKHGGIESAPPAEAGHPPRHRYDKKVAFQIWQGGDRLLTHSFNAPDRRFSSKDEGFSSVEIDGRAWRVFSTWDPTHRYLLQVADAAQSRGEIGEEIAAHLLLPLVFGLPLLGLLLGGFVVLAFRPLRQLADSIAAQAPERLQAIALSRAPREIVPILDRLNRLFAEVSRAQEDERRFTADAAHELRTPLAVLQTNAEVASAAGDDASRRRALDHLVSGSRRAARLIDQLLMLARLDAQAALPDSETCVLHGLLAAAVAPLIPGALAKNIEVEIVADEKTGVRGSPLLLQALVRNLVDNAIRYTPPGGRVRVVLLPGGDGGPVLHVMDSGPGLPAEASATGIGRFRRFDRGGEEGHGLGLSIVKRIAELHGGRLDLAPAGPDGGLDAAVRFPARDAAV